MLQSLNRVLLNNPQIHEKLAEKINEKITTVENQPPDTIAKNVVAEIDIEAIVDEIIGNIKLYYQGHFLSSSSRLANLIPWR